MLGAAREAFLPGRGLFQLTHFVTAACDARCGHCFYRVNREKRELSLDEIRRVARSLGRLRFLLISGGEPFLRKDLPGIVETYFRETSFVNLSIPTNGLRTDEILRAVREICEISPTLSFSLSISLDGFRDLHDSLRGVAGIYDCACRTLAGAKEIQASYPNLFVGVLTTLMEQNQGELARFTEFIYREFRPDSHTLNLWRGDAPGDRPKGVSPETYLELNRKLAKLYSGGRARSLKRRVRDNLNELRYGHIARVWREGRFLLPCRAGERECVLAEDGEVFPCELMFNCSLGNVRGFEYDLMRLLAGERARAFIGWRNEHRCFCTHECNTRTLLLLHPSTLLRSLLPRRPKD
jgi:MoaA/NifB/PqqE/SkfB family radical SAM enzyme